MRQILLFLLILLIPVSSYAAYNIYLKNGSVISGVSSYEKKGGEVTVYFGGGSLEIAEKDILKIEEAEVQEKDLRSKEMEGTQEKQEKPTEVVPTPQPPADDKSAKVDALKADLAAIYSEIRAVEEEEARLVASINEKIGMRPRLNVYQIRQADMEIEPLRQELTVVRQKKEDLLKRKASLEDELRALGQ